MIILDRIEADKAVLLNETKQATVIDKNLLAKTCKEGDVVEQAGDGMWYPNPVLTQQQREKTLLLLKQIGAV